MGRRDSQEQLPQRMKQMSLYPNDSQYPNGYCGHRPTYDHYVSSPGSERQQYVQYFTSPAAPPGNSYSSVVSRGKDVAVGKKCSIFFFSKFYAVTVVGIVYQVTGVRGISRPHTLYTLLITCVRLVISLSFPDDKFLPSKA